MADVFHKNITTTQGIHIIHAFEAANTAARTGLSISSGDVGKVVKQIDTTTWWLITSTAPAFVQLGGSGVVNNLNATTAPTVNDSATNGGYSTGSFWFDETNDKAYACLDATHGSAVWFCITDPDVGGDLSGTASAATVTAIQGRDVFNSAPSDGQVLTWDNGNSRWSPATPTSDPTLGGDLSGTASVAVVEAIQGQGVETGTPTNGDVLTWSTANGQWEHQAPVGGDATSIQSIPVDAATPTDAQVFIYDGSVDNEWEPKSISGDVSITRDGVATVAALNGETIQATAPSTGDILIADGAGNWNHYTVKQDLSMDTSGFFTVLGLQSRDVHDAAPADGEVLTWVTANNRWEPQPGGSGSTNATQIQSTPVDAAGPTDAQILIYDGAVDNEWEPKSISGDMSITRDGAATVTHIQGIEVTTTNPTNGQILVYDGTTSFKWEPATVGGDLSVAYTGSPVLDYTVAAIQGVDVHTVAPGDGEALVYDSGNTRYEPAEVLTLNGSGRLTGNIHYLDGFGNFVLPTYPTNPASLDDGQMFLHSSEFRVKVRDHNVEWYLIPWVREVMLLDGTQAMTGDLDVGNQDVINISGIELPNATSSGGLPAATGNGNLGLRIDATGDGTLGVYVSDGTSWVALPVTVNGSGRFIGNIHFLDDEGRMTLPQWNSAPGSPLDDGEIYFDPTLDEVRVRSTTLGGWLRMQSAQKLTWGCGFRVLPTATDSTFYGPTTTANTTDGIADWDYSYGDDGGSNPVVSAVNYPYARGFLVPEAGTITKILFTVAPHDGAMTANANVRVNALIITPNYGTDTTTTQVLVATTSVSRTFLNTEEKIEKIELTLNNTTVAEGDIIVPVLTSGDFSAMVGGPTGNVTITVEVNKGV